MPDLSLEDLGILSKSRVLGGEVGLVLSDAELIRLIEVILTDLGLDQLRTTLGLNASSDYFSTSIASFIDASPPQANVQQTFLTCAAKIPDFRTYFKCLCEIHKRRRKYSLILEGQRFPSAQQVTPRSMLEFGLLEDKALASWMSWRKWLFDLDNRAGQETGYMFEPILAASLGGIPYSAKISPVRRSSDQSKGRQVDCIVGMDAYEFKLRVTIAASGQARFAEELAFPADCKASSFRPVLVVLDPTPNAKLDLLVSSFSAAGGESHVGPDAWAHLESRAGSTMATFLERYVRLPLDKIAPLIPEPLDMTLSHRPNGNVHIEFSGGVEREIRRPENENLSEVPEDE